MAGIVVQVSSPGAALRHQRNTLLQQVLVNIDDAAAGKYFVELVALQLIVTSATTHHHRFNVQVVQRVGHSVKKHAVVGDDFLGLVGLPAPALRVAATQIAGGQHRLHPRVPQHGLGRQAHLTEQALRAAARKVEHRLRLGGRRLRIANNRDVIRVLNVQERARGPFGQPAGHLLVDEVNDLLFDGRRPH